MVLGDFKEGKDNSDMSVFCDTCDLKCIIKEPTCYKNPENLSWNRSYFDKQSETLLNLICS